MNALHAHTSNIPSDAEFALFAARCAMPRDASAPLVWSVEDSDRLWQVYLNAFPPEDRQHHNCNTCRRFITGAGSLVTVSETGKVEAVFWGEEPETSYYGRVAAAMRRELARATPTRPFFETLSSGWGTATTRTQEDWSHWYANPARQWTKGSADHAGAVEQGVGVVQQALSEIGSRTLDLAADLIATGRIPRAEKVTPLVEALLACQRAPRASRENVARYWLGRVPNLCHVRGSVAMTFLEDLRDSRDLEGVISRFKAKVDPLAYMRPTALPSQQTIERAEKMFIEAGYNRALARRWARVDEIPCSWRPTNTPAPAESAVFKGVRAKGAISEPPLTPVGGTKSVSWRVFARDVLPKATKIEYLTHGSPAYIVFFTEASDPTAPNLLKGETTLAHYCNVNGTRATQVGLAVGTWVPVPGIMSLPRFEDRKYALLGGSIPKEMGHTGLFPECLRHEAHAFRSVIEEYNKQNRIPMPTPEDNTIVGVSVVDARFRVTTASGLVSEYLVDRME